MRCALRFVVLCVGCLAFSFAAAAHAQCDSVQRSRLDRPDRSEEEDGYASALALAPDYALIGAPYGDSRGQKAGAVYVFKRDAARWILEGTIGPPGREPSAFFGSALAIHDGVVVIGARWSSDESSRCGAAYVYRRAQGSWILDAKLQSLDCRPGDNQGGAVDIHGDLVVTGPGYRHSPRHIVRCFRKNLHAWSEEAALVATDGGPLDSFGASVAAFDNVVAVGAPHHGDAGAVYIFRFRRGVWTQEAKLIPSDLHDEAGFGLSVEIERDVLVVGAPYGPADHETGGSTGSVFIFRLRDGVWIEETRIRGSSAFRDSRFGYSVALSNDALLVGAPTSNDGPPWRGHAYLFQFQGNSWVERARLASPDQPWAEDYFGRTVALATDTALVGAPYYDPWRPHVRSAYLFRLGETPRISVDGSCPAGESATIDWTCATPHGRVALLYSARSRSLVIPDRYPCHGAALGLSGPRLHLVSSELWSDENGAGSLEGFIPDAACGGFLQLIDLETCAVSNVARIE